MKALVLYHGSCQDGFAAAWCAHRRFGDSAEYRAVQYGDDPPADDLHGREVYILDFSYLPEFVEKAAEEANPLVLLDHHKTALERFREVWGGGVREVAPTRVGTPRPESVVWKPHENAFVEVDPSRSGAQIAWDYFHGGEHPWIVDYVADRDLWTWKLPKSREVNAYLRSLPYDFAAWSALKYQGAPASDEATWVAHYHLGEAILQSQEREIERAVGRARRVRLPLPPAFETKGVGHLEVALGTSQVWTEVLAVNTTENVSEVLNQLAKEPPYWAVGWFQDETGRYSYSLRSTEQGPDVSAIARAFGGGGHARAAGFDADRLLF